MNGGKKGKYSFYNHALQGRKLAKRGIVGGKGGSNYETYYFPC